MNIRIRINKTIGDAIRTSTRFLRSTRTPRGRETVYPGHAGLQVVYRRSPQGNYTVDHDNDLGNDPEFRAMMTTHWMALRERAACEMALHDDDGNLACGRESRALITLCDAKIEELSQ